mmetsp:Transcript_9674/g.24163  ORF Transcript_9674/g.24163 Transcript_9674/m.24163 type:complete len:261 (-) Transcript_9674:661-1443(-)
MTEAVEAALGEKAEEVLFFLCCLLLARFFSAPPPLPPGHVKSCFPWMAVLVTLSTTALMHRTTLVPPMTIPRWLARWPSHLSTPAMPWYLMWELTAIWRPIPTMGPLQEPRLCCCCCASLGSPSAPVTCLVAPSPPDPPPTSLLRATPSAPDMHPTSPICPLFSKKAWDLSATVYLLRGPDFSNTWLGSLASFCCHWNLLVEPKARLGAVIQTRAAFPAQRAAVLATTCFHSFLKRSLPRILSSQSVLPAIVSSCSKPSL